MVLPNGKFPVRHHQHPAGGAEDGVFPRKHIGDPLLHNTVAVLQQRAAPGELPGLGQPVTDTAVPAVSVGQVQHCFSLTVPVPVDALPAVPGPVGAVFDIVGPDILPLIPVRLQRPAGLEGFVDGCHQILPHFGVQIFQGADHGQDPVPHGQLRGRGRVPGGVRPGPDHRSGNPDRGDHQISRPIGAVDAHIQLLQGLFQDPGRDLRLLPYPRHIPGHLSGGEDGRLLQAVPLPAEPELHPLAHHTRGQGLACDHPSLSPVKFKYQHSHSSFALAPERSLPSGPLPLGGNRLAVAQSRATFS